MKLLISASLLASKLKELPLDAEEIFRATLENSGVSDFGTLTLITPSKSISINVCILKFQASLKQNDRRWDWVLKDLKKMEDKPIVLEIYEKCVNIIMQY